jgi:uncharacterized cysteine cluster protein YcgN (CxxCxxCC family)
MKRSKLWQSGHKVNRNRHPDQGGDPAAAAAPAALPIDPAEPPTMAADKKPFWQRKSLAEMTDSEWESLCDGCGRCCLVKLEDADDSSRTFFTDVGCRLLDGDSCRCRDYPNRTAKVKDCVRLTPRNINRIVWLPPTCAYRLLADGGDLYWWHPLVSGDPETVHEAGISVRGRVGAGEDEVADADLEDRIVSWPVRMPKAARAKRRPR